MTIDWIKQRIRKNEYEYSDHADFEREQDKLFIEDVEEAILTGEIIEDYLHDPRGPSCLMLGYASEDLPLHIVCGKVTEDILRK